MADARFAARPAALVADAIADALDWPRTRPARIVAGSRGTPIGRLVLCPDEATLATVDAPADAAIVLASPPESGDGRLGRRLADPFAGNPDDVASWRRAERVVFDASLLLAGGAGGIDEQLSTAAGIASTRPLRPIPRDAAKFVGYAPVDAFEATRDAVFDAGGGTIGEYDRCSWSTRGTGTFRGGDGSSPAVGSRGEFEQVEEVRFETIVRGHLVDAVCRAFVDAHPYEEPAYDVVALSIPADVGFGRVGSLDAGGGSAAWTALGAIDPELVAYGPVSSAASGATCAVYAGPLRDVHDHVLRTEGLALVVVSQVDDADLAQLVEAGIGVLVVDRMRALAACADAIAGRLTRALTLPVTVSGGAPLAFPSGDAAPAPTEQVAGDYGSGAWRLHFDGGSRGNPGPAAYGWVLYDPDGNEHEADGVNIGTATNNVAEWTGLLRGLEHAADRGIRELQVRGDSELVVKQVTGVYKVKNAQLKPLAEQVAAVLRRFDRYDVRHVYRADNARADAVANEAMDGLR